MEDRCNVVSGAGSGEKTGSRVLKVLEFVEDFGAGAIEDAVQ